MTESTIGNSDHQEDIADQPPSRSHAARRSQLYTKAMPTTSKGLFESFMQPPCPHGSKKFSWLSEATTAAWSPWASPQEKNNMIDDDVSSVSETSSSHSDKATDDVLHDFPSSAPSMVAGVLQGHCLQGSQRVLPPYSSVVGGFIDNFEWSDCVRFSAVLDYFDDTTSDEEDESDSDDRSEIYEGGIEKTHISKDQISNTDYCDHQISQNPGHAQHRSDEEMNLGDISDDAIVGPLFQSPNHLGTSKVQSKKAIAAFDDSDLSPLHSVNPPFCPPTTPVTNEGTSRSSDRWCRASGNLIMIFGKPDAELRRRAQARTRRWDHHAVFAQGCAIKRSTSIHNLLPEVDNDDHDDYEDVPAPEEVVISEAAARVSSLLIGDHAHKQDNNNNNSSNSNPFCLERPNPVHEDDILYHVVDTDDECDDDDDSDDLFIERADSCPAALDVSMGLFIPLGLYC